MNYEVHTLKERCKGCLICVELCQADVLGVSEEVNRNGHHFPCVKEPEACINCGMCEMFCPDLAIWVTSREEKVTA